MRKHEKLTMTATNQIRPHNSPCSLRPLAGPILILIMVLIVVPGGHASDDRFSMQIQDKTLAEVFQDLTRISGRSISFDKEWTDQPINVRFVNLTLEMAITKILTNLNHVVIFEQDNIQVKIYGVASPEKDINRASAVNPIPNRTTTNRNARPLARPFPLNTGQKDEIEEETEFQEISDPDTSETEDGEDTENMNEEKPPEEQEAEDTENTNEEKIPEEQEGADENETTSPESDKDTESSTAND